VIHVFRYTLVVVYTILVGVPACLLGLFGAGDTVVKLGVVWVRAILWSCGIRVEVSGLENVDRRRPSIFMSNHQSVIDIAAILATIPVVNVRFVAKRELTRIPLFGWALPLSGQIIVDRGNRARAIESLRRGAERIRAGTHVIVFPEGTRSQTGSLAGFKSGGFHLALQAAVPIVPVSVSGSHHITPKRSLKIHSGLVRIHYGVPIRTDDLTVEDRNRLKERVHSAILAGFDPELQPMDPAVRPPTPQASELPTA
jgi:1-acyl-sn-glycerol-3-phosphate acyltransferase